MFFLGVDQSLTSPGLALVDGETGQLHAVRNLKNKLRGVERLAYIREELVKFLTDQKPVFAALEGYSIRSVNRPFDLGEVGGLVRLALYDASIPFIVVAPTQLKKFVTGDGDASKEKVQEWLRKKWNVDLSQDDQADAFGLAQVARVYRTRQTTYRSELEVVTTIEASDKKVIRSTTSKSRTKIET
jgi:crossover junction endodeoxyribonuclease RuvC